MGNVIKKKLSDLRDDLLLLSVFRGVLRDPVVDLFMQYAEGDREGREPARAVYARMVAHLYENGESLADYISRIVFEDENVYVRSRAQGKSPSPSVTAAAKWELKTLSALAELNSTDFSLDMGLDYVPPFESRSVDLATEYEKRISEISRFGYGIFASRGMFRVTDGGEIVAIESSDRISMDSFIGYADERKRVLDNTVAFVEGRPAANTLLCGDAGTGKSSTVKAVANALFDRGIRLIELRKDQLSKLPYVMGRINGNPLKFIIFVDDLSFNQNDDNFSMLKAALEGSASAKAENAVIYATSNRRHIIKESFADRDGDDVHRNDTLAETLSLSERFGLTVYFGKPDKKLYLEIVHTLCDRYGIDKPISEIDVEAEAFALRRGYRSARCAEHFVSELRRKA